MGINYNINSLIHDLYEVISGPAGQKRDWNSMRQLYFPGTHLIRTSTNDDKTPQALVMDVETYIANTSDYFLRNGFYEHEIARQTNIFGNAAQAFSTYEARHNQNDFLPFKRGVNFIQLFYDGQRWWIINVIWDNERHDNPLPETYIQSKN